MSQAATQIMRSYNEQVASTTKPASLVSEAIAGPPMCLGCGGDYYCFSWNCPASLLPPPYADCTEDGGSGCTVVHVCCGTDSSNPLCGHPGACGWY
jgi:hypothetical protein